MIERGENLYGETYAYDKVIFFLESLKKDPEKMKKFREQALKRAKDVFESSGLEGEIKKDDRVLYIGAGTGHVPEYIQEKTGANVARLDLVDLRTEDIKDADKGEFIIGNARALPFADNSFDDICLFDIMHHTTNQDEIIEEAIRVLKPGGKFMAMEDTVPFEFEKTSGIMKKIVGLMDDLFNLQPHGVNPHGYRSIDEWEELFQKLGLKFSRSDSWYWGPADFMGASRDTRPEQRTLLRPFESTFFKFIKPIQSK